MGANKGSPDQYQLRFPPGLRERVKRIADLNGRSMNAEIIRRLEGAVDPDADGYVRLWLPQDLIDRIETAAVHSSPEVEMRDALERAFPYRPTLRDYVRSLRKVLDQSSEANFALEAFVESAEDSIDTHPEIGDRPLDVPDRGWEVGP